MTNEPKYIGEDSYRVLKSDALKMFKKGKHSTIPFLIIIMILLNITILFALYKSNEIAVNFEFTQILFILILPIVYLIFNMSVFAFNDVFNHLYTESKFKMEENTDTFFHSFKHVKIMWQTIKYSIFFFCVLLATAIFITSFQSLFFDSVSIESVQTDLSEQDINEMKALGLFLMYAGFFIVQIFLFNNSLYKKENEFTSLNMNLIYMNQRFLNMRLEESIVFTQKGVDKNKVLFEMLDRNRICSFLIFVPFVNLFLHMYYIFLYQAAWQRIYNNKEGITAKEEIKSLIYNKNTVVN